MTQYDLDLFSYNKTTKILHGITEKLDLKNFPDRLTIKSSKTGQVVTFVYDNEAALQNEFWDGEMAEYLPNPPIARVKKLVISHG